MKVYRGPDSSGRLSQQSKYDRQGKIHCEVSVFVHRINSTAPEAELRGMKVGGCVVRTTIPLLW